MKVAYKEMFKMIILGTLSLILVAIFIFGAFWGAKTITYAHLYKDLVEQTISEMVKPEYLK